MTDDLLLNTLLDLPHVRIIACDVLSRTQVQLTIESDTTAALCPHCQQLTQNTHGHTSAIRLRDLPLWGRHCELLYSPRRYRCEQCEQTFVERVVWREPDFSYTLRYEQHIYERTRQESIAQVARNEHLSEERVQGLFERWAKKHSTNAAIHGSKS